MLSFGSVIRVLLLTAIVTFVPTGRAQSLPIFTDGFNSGFDDWSWASHSNTNTSPVHSGSRSMSVSANAWEGISFHHPNMDTSRYLEFSFWTHGGAGGGQLLQVYGELNAVPQAAYQLPSALLANTWQQWVIPLSTLQVSNKLDLSRLNIQLRAGGSTSTFYLDDVYLTTNSVPLPPPPPVNVTVNATQAVRSVESRWFGANTAIWDSNFDTPQTVSLLREMKTTVLRFPGGSLSDEYHWASNKSLTNNWTWATSFGNFCHVATNANIKAQVYVTVNYGSGTAEEAAAWVRHANVTNNLGFKYWEIGNENYGTWERDTNEFSNHAYTYAVRATNYFAQMKAADPTIKIGMPVVTGEESYNNGYSDHPAFNPRTGQTHNGWTPVLLSTLKSLGVTPDYFVYHFYHEWTNPSNPSSSNDDDASLLQASSNWAADAANLRQQIADYFGPGGTNIELVVTENNSDSGAQGRQSTSLVNGLYYADSLGALMKTEFNAFIWWDLRNGTDTGGFFGPNIYGWRNYGDLGFINGPTNRHPTFYAAKLMTSFVSPGDTVLTASSDYPLLSAYAARRASGALSLLVLNKSKTATLTGQFAVAGFVPSPVAITVSYGIPQDEATRTNAAYTLQDLATNNFAGAGSSFTSSFAPLSISLLNLNPTAPSLAVPPQSSPGSFVYQLQGQLGVRYFMQASTTLTNWITVSTNTLTGDSLTVTNTITPNAPRRYWRALWQP